MLLAASRAFSDLASPPFRSVLWKSVGLTLLFLVAAFALAAALIRWLIALGNAWLEAVLEIVAAFGILFGLIFLVPPVVSLVASLFLDDIAATVERTRYPADPPGRAPPVVPSLLLSVRFFALTVVVNALAVLMLLVPGINLFAFLVANGYLLGREYFELAAFRHHPPDEARALRKRHAFTVFLAGLMIAGLLAIPLLNLAAPLFATAFMVHLHKHLLAAYAPDDRARAL